MAIPCPFCHKPDAVNKHGTNRGGTARLRRLACNKTFTPNPNPRQVSEEKERRILHLLAERLSQYGITDWRERPIFTDHWDAYKRFFPASQHTA